MVALPTIVPSPSLVAPGPRRIFIGVDIAKENHVAGFVSPALLSSKRRFDRCPTLSFENSRSGFEKLLDAMKTYAPLQECCVLMERTGHYGQALKQYLQEQGVEVFDVHAGKRMSREKTDRRDALSLANALYSQEHLGVQVLDELQRIHRCMPPTPTASALHGLMRRRYELDRDIVRRKNKLVAIADELFPEFAAIFKDPAGFTALAMRSAFPTPQDIAKAGIEDLMACRRQARSTQPSNANLAALQNLARQSIGTKQPGRIRCLIVEQQQLIDELRILETHMDALDAEITQIIDTSREGAILTSLPGIQAVSAAEIIAAIDNIANFERASKLRGYFGWSPVATQTGISKDSSALTRGGNRRIKKAMYLIVWRAIRDDTEFRVIYERLVKAHCAYDERKKKHVGKNKVMGRIAGQIIGVIYALLKRDHDTLAALGAGEETPEPVLYDREKHRAHRRA